MVTQAFLENRARFPIGALKSYRGKWVAFCADGTHIVAGATTLEELEAQLRAMHIDCQSVVFEGVPGPDDEPFLAFAETVYLGDEIDDAQNPGL